MKNETPEQNNTATAKIETPNMICDSRCKICTSNFVEKIHKLRKSGFDYTQIVEAVGDLGLTISRSSLCRHFQNYNEKVKITSARIINDDLLEEATKQATHTTRLVSLIDSAFDILETRMKASNYAVDISDLDKLMKLRYQILSGGSADENDVLAIFQKASDKYGLDVNQGILFKPGNSRALSNE